MRESSNRLSTSNEIEPVPSKAKVSILRREFGDNHDDHAHEHEHNADEEMESEAQYKERTQQYGDLDIAPLDECQDGQLNSQDGEQMFADKSHAMEGFD